VRTMLDLALLRVPAIPDYEKKIRSTAVSL
jgi:hypothetical protein